MSLRYLAVKEISYNLLTDDLSMIEKYVVDIKRKRRNDIFPQSNR